MHSSFCRPTLTSQILVLHSHIDAGRHSSCRFGWFALANLWLTFSIIIKLVPKGENPTYFFGTAEITHWVNLACQWLYAATLAMQFILALGNRPKGEVYSYVASFTIFAVSPAR